MNALARPHGIASASSTLLAPGGAFELIEEDVRGVRLKVFRNAPPNLHALYAQSLEHADKTFFVYEEERYTFADAWRNAEHVIAGLNALGVRPGDRVGIAMRNYPEWLFAFMGITSMGAVAVAMNAWWTGPEMRYAIDDSGLRTLFVDGERKDRLTPHLEGTSLQLITVRCATTDSSQCQTWHDFIGSNARVPHIPDVQPDDHATILYTSGSTSKPKGVVSSHRAIIHSLMGWEASAALARTASGACAASAVTPAPRTAQHAMILTVPLFHVTGLNGQLLPAFRNGRKVIGMHKWDAEKALAIIEVERVTHFSGVPSMAYELVNSPHYEKYDLSSLRSIGGGGAAMTPKHSRRIEERSGNRTRASAAYAMTETNGLATANVGANLHARPASCGTALQPLVEIRINGRDGRPLAPGETGEICIKGAMNFTCYWNCPEDTARTLIDGWVQTGDLGHMDTDGFIFITDRAKEMIIRGGENIACQELESVLYEHPQIAECAVFGLPDDRLGESVAAVIRVRPGATLTAEDVQQHVAQHLARFKVPAHVWIRRAELPRTASGKIFKRDIRNEALAQLEQLEQVTQVTQVEQVAHSANLAEPAMPAVELQSAQRSSEARAAMHV